jgi:hypothetical protein
MSLQVGTTVEYFSLQNGGKYIKSVVTHVAPNGDIKIDHKPNSPITVAEQAEKIRFPESSSSRSGQDSRGNTGMTPEPKRVNSGAGTQSYPMTPLAGPWPMQDHPLGAPQGFANAASAVPQLPKAADAPVTQEWMTQLLAGHTGTIQQEIQGVRNELQSLGSRVLVVEGNVKQHDRDIVDLRTEVATLKTEIAGIKKNHRSSSVPARTGNGQNTDRRCEAFLGGFPTLAKRVLEARAKAFVGEAAGLVDVSTQGNVNNYAFVKFSSEEAAKAFVEARKEAATTASLKLKMNRSKEERARGAIIWQGYNALKDAGLERDNVSFSRNHFWSIGEQGLAKDIGEMKEGGIHWNAEAPKCLHDKVTTPA